MSLDKNHPDYLEFRSRIRENPSDFIAIIGAGLSRPCGLPSWGELRDILAKNASARISEIPEEEKSGYRAKINRISTTRDLWISFSELKQILPRPAYEQCIKDSCSVVNKNIIPETYDLIWNLNIKGVVSFNIDTCITDSYSKVRRCAVDVATGFEVSRFAQFLPGTQHFVFQPHGHISDPSTWVFTNDERTKLLGNKPYIDFMSALCQTKHLVILGYNPQDFAFEYLIQNVLSGKSTTGSKHYIIMPTADPGLIKSYGEKGFVIIPYEPSDNKIHPEITELLKDCLQFIPKDDVASSVYIGKKTNAFNLPDDKELLQLPVNSVRELLNGAVASIIPPEKSPEPHDIEELEKFYNKHLRAIHMAWLVQPDSDCNIIHGYKVIEIKGRGAFGQVFLAEDVTKKERVAIKILLPEIRQKREYLNSFRRGVRSMRILTQRRVEKMVRIIDAFEVPACIIMDYIEGPTLSEAKKWNYLNELHRCLDVLVQVGEVVHIAHNLEERVLHRDLKPDNVILRDSYDSNSPLDVVVLDFDLSWHKGAMELSVIQGALAQGYAAPEQTATGMRPGISTRNTAVDVFGYGMLAYFVLTGMDPRPNEHNFPQFEGRIKALISEKLSSKWFCLPPYLAYIIAQCTQDKQEQRIAFSVAVEAFREAQKMAINDSIPSHNPLILDEMAARLESEGTVERNDFNRHLIIIGLDRSKKINLKLENEYDTFFVSIEISKMRSEGDDRHFLKYIPKAKDKALSKLNTEPFRKVSGEIGLSQLTVKAEWVLKDAVTRNEIKAICSRIVDARSQMEFN